MPFYWYAGFGAKVDSAEILQEGIAKLFTCLIPAVQHVHASRILSHIAPQYLHFSIPSHCFLLPWNYTKLEGACTLSNTPNGGFVYSSVIYTSTTGGLCVTNPLYSACHAEQLMLHWVLKYYIQIWCSHHCHKMNLHVMGWGRLPGAPNKGCSLTIQNSPHTACLVHISVPGIDKMKHVGRENETIRHDAESLKVIYLFSLFPPGIFFFI